MDNQEKFDLWLNISTEDLKAADTLFNGEHWLHSAFHCQ
jgi:hypothetical protein